MQATDRGPSNSEKRSPLPKLSSMCDTHDTQQSTVCSAKFDALALPFCNVRFHTFS